MLIRKDTPIIQCGRLITGQEIKQIQETVRLFPQLSLKELTETICEHLNWYTASGSNKSDACLKLLKKLEDHGHFQLPKKRALNRSKTTDSSIVFTSRTQARPDITGTLNSLGLVSLEIVEGKESKGLWKEYMSRYHYLGNTKPFGYYLRYFIKCDQEVLGCALFSGAAKSIGVRDQWIGWTENQRLKNLSWVINNTRFLIFPWVRVKYLASHVLGRIARRIGKDWHDRWRYYPVLMETFVDKQYYRGTCYKASNWKDLGMTTGGGLVRKGKSYNTTPKIIFVNPLNKKFKDILCSDELAGRTQV